MSGWDQYGFRKQVKSFIRFAPVRCGVVEVHGAGLNHVALALRGAVLAGELPLCGGDNEKS